MGIIKKYLFTKSEMTPKDYSYARVGFTIDSAMSTGIANLVGGTYMTGLLAFLGASEAESAFILSLTLFGGFFQIFVPLLIKRLKYKKPYVLFCKFFDRMPMALIFLIPIIFGVGKMSVIAVGILTAFTYIVAYLWESVYLVWMEKSCSENGRLGKFYGNKDAVVYVVLIAAYFVGAQITKRFTGDREIYGYMWLGIISIAMWAVMMVAMFFVKYPYEKEEKNEEEAGILKGIKLVFTSRKTRPFLVYYTIYYFGFYFMNSFANVMCVQRMKMSLEILSYITMGYFILMSVCSPFFGKLTDKLGAKKIVFAGTLVMMSAYVLCAFMTPGNVVILKLISAVLSAVANAMLSPSVFVLKMSSLPDESRPQCLACMSSFFLLVASVASWIAAWFVGAANGLTAEIFGMEFREMNLVFFAGCALIVVSAVVLLLQGKKKAE